jgi:hypothetical protein
MGQETTFEEATIEAASQKERRHRVSDGDGAANHSDGHDHGPNRNGAHDRHGGP